MSPASSRWHQARACSGGGAFSKLSDRSASRAMVISAMRADFLASRKLAAQPQRGKKDEADRQNDTTGREGDVFVALGVVDLVAHAVVDHDADDGQEGEQEEAQETHRKGHQKAGKEPEIAQGDAEELSLGPRTSLPVQVLLLCIHDRPQNGDGAHPSTQLEY